MKAFLALCASALLVQTISGQCIGAAPLPLTSSGCGNSLGYGGLNNIAGTSGGAFTVTSSSPIAPTGITVVSENNIEGPLAVSGQLPLLAAVAVEGEVPSSGAGAISYTCGSENVGIVSEGPGAGVGLGGPGYGNGLAGPIGPRGIPSGYGLPASGYGLPASGYGLPAGPRGCSGI